MRFWASSAAWVRSVLSSCCLRSASEFKKFPKADRMGCNPSLAGLLVGLMGWFIPEVLGVGYDYVDVVLSGDFAIKTVVVAGRAEDHRHRRPVTAPAMPAAFSGPACSSAR